MAIVNKQAIKGLRADRTTESGRRCIDVAAALIAECDDVDTRGGARALTEIMREARGWVKLGLECDAAANHAKLAEIHERLAARENEANSIARMRSAFQ